MMPGGGRDVVNANVGTTMMKAVGTYLPIRAACLKRRLPTGWTGPIEAVLHRRTERGRMLLRKACGGGTAGFAASAARFESNLPK